MIKRFFSTIRAANTPPSIHVSHRAWDKLIEISKAQSNQSFLFSATGGGCNGFNYKLNLIDNEAYKNITDSNMRKIKPSVFIKQNTNLLIDPMSEFLLLGTTIDYVREDYSNGIFENKFIFIPDKTLATSCGCGISFTPKS